jgi:hypothetical protein
MSTDPELVPAGSYWVPKYPTSRSLDDLVEPFRSGVVAFLDDLASRGCVVHVNATRRPSERAWLMHYAWDVAHGAVEPDAVPAHDPPIPIAWTKAGTLEMVSCYGLAYRPSLTSRHIQGRALDMKVEGWTGTAEELHALGASHGVHKLLSDPPHWSDDGR